MTAVLEARDLTGLDVEIPDGAPPGIPGDLEYDRDAEGRLVAVRGGGMLYLEERDGVRVYAGGLARVREAVVGSALLRHVETATATWTETYLWDDAGHLAQVDGVTIERDGLGRVTACLSRDGAWRYAYAGDHLIQVEAPSGRRRFSVGPDGRPVRWQVGNRTVDLSYDAAGRRRDVPGAPPSWEQDPLGRLWTVRGADGRALATYLWDGFACLGRIDGPPGAPLGAVFSLDPSLTPVRIIQAGRVVRVPRDAFGEGLLAHPGVPGLHGGATHRGFVFYRSRALDAVIGAFTAPDPWNGDEDDPRRGTGYRGPLPVEPAAGPYAVCRYDPIGRVDSTGEMSAVASGGLLTLLSLTWSSQHNLAGLFFLDVLNFLIALFSFSGHNLGRWISKSGVSSSWHGGWGFRFDPVGLEKLNINVDRPWTYQHLVWARKDTFDELAVARVFVPATAFRPSLYGTVLRFRPIYNSAHENPPGPFILRGASNGEPTGLNSQLVTRAPGWTRAGGPAEPVIPGSPIPHFPSGGFHFAKREDVPCTQDRTLQEGELSELEPVGVVVTGTFDTRKLLVLPRISLGLAAPNLLLLTDSTVAELVTVQTVAEVGSETRVRLQADPTLVSANGLRVRGLGAPVATETLNRTGDRFDARAPASGTRYTAGTLLRMNPGGAPPGVAFIDRLDAAVQVDSPLAAPGGRPPFHLRLSQPVGPSRTIAKSGADRLTFPASQAPPAEGEAILVEGGGAAQALLVTAEPSAQERTVDRPIDAAIVDPITWRSLAGVTPLGTWDGATGIGTTDLGYAPERSGEAPASGHLLVKDADNRNRLARSVRALDRDELILKSPPAGPNGAYALETIPIQPPDVSDTSLRTVTALVLDRPIDPALTALPRPALQLDRLEGATFAAATTPMVSAAVISNATVTGTGITIDSAAGVGTFLAGQAGTRALTPGQLVVLRGGAGTSPEPVLVKEVWLTATLGATLPLSGSNLEIVPLVAGSPAYQAGLVNGPAGVSRVVLQPTAFRLDPAIPGREPLRGAGGAIQTVEVQMPRFRAGELVEALWGSASPVNRERFRVKHVDGTTLDLESPAGAGLPAGPVDLAVTRLIPGDPGTGGSRLGVGGSVVSAGGSTQVRVRAWQPNALTVGQTIAVTDGTTSIPATVTSVDRVDIVFYSVPASYTGAAGVSVIVPGHPAAGTNPAFVTDYTVDGNELLLAGSPLRTGNNLVAVIPFQAPADPARTVRGVFSPGTSMIPEDDSDTWELERRESLATHELYHTHQSARLGPVLLTPVPWFLWEVGGAIGGADMEAPEYSPYVKATLLSEGAHRFLEIPDRQGIEFAADRRVQVSQNGATRNLTLGAVDGNRFRLGAGFELEDGTDLFVRLRRTAGTERLRWTNALGDLLSLGGVMNTVWGPLLTGIPWLVIQTVHVLRGNTFKTPWWLEYFPATVPDPDRPAAIQIGAVNGGRPALQPFDSVMVSAAGTSTRTSVTAVGADGQVELASPPPSEGENRSLRIALVEHDDPLNFASTWAINHMGFGWLRYLFDPYSQLHFRGRPKTDSFWDWFMRVARWGFSSTSWSGFPFGYFFFDNLLPQGRGEGFLANMEQRASEESGDLYSPIGRLRSRPSHVGDIGRYWYYHADRDASVVSPDRQDAPGVHLGLSMAPGPRLLPSFTLGTFSAILNGRRGAATASGIQVPDVFVEKDLQSPDLAPAGGPTSFLPGTLGWIPGSPELERTLGAYVAFSRPGTHFVTVADGVPGAGEAARAQREGVQSINFEVAVADVEVLVAGRPVANGETIRLVQCQRAPIEVRPGGERRYSALLTRPRDGEILRRSEALILQAQTTDGAEPVEIGRDYVSGPPRSAPSDSRNANSRAFPEIHLGDELAIPVRAFRVEVVRTLPVVATIDVATVRAGLAQSPTAVPEARPGSEVFVVVPASIQASRPRQSQAYDGPTSPFITHPGPAIVPERGVPVDVRRLVGDGGFFRVTFAPDDPPEEPVTLTWEIDVRATQTGAGGAPETRSAVLTAGARLLPHFRIEEAGGGTTFELSRGSADPTMVLRPSDGVRAGSVVVVPSANLTTSISPAGDEVTVTAVAGTGLGTRRVIVTDAADPTRFARRSIRIIG